MRPEDRDLDEEIRGHLALSVQERIERGEDPDAARLAALREFGYVPAIRDSMRRVWYSRWFDATAALGRDLRIGLRSLLRAKCLAATVAVRAALGASNGALRRTLLAESLVLCGAGAVLGLVVARPLVHLVAGFAARFSVRALDVTVDRSLLWVGAGLAMAAAVLLAYVPRLPSTHAPAGLGLASAARGSRRGPIVASACSR
jgi:hypothetical protein